MPALMLPYGDFFFENRDVSAGKSLQQAVRSC
jgi:hypothetical protein